MDNDKCIICLEGNDNIKKCNRCTAYICESCRFEYVVVRKNHKCPHCRSEDGIWKNDFRWENDFRINNYDFDEIVNYDHRRRVISFTNTNFDIYLSPIIKFIGNIHFLFLISLNLILRLWMEKGSSSILMLINIIPTRKLNHHLLSIILFRFGDYLYDHLNNHVNDNFEKNYYYLFFGIYLLSIFAYFNLKNRELFLTSISYLISKEFLRYGRDHNFLIGLILSVIYIHAEFSFYVRSNIRNHYNILKIFDKLKIDFINYHIITYVFLNEYSIIESFYQICLNKMNIIGDFIN